LKNSLALEAMGTMGATEKLVRQGPLSLALEATCTMRAIDMLARWESLSLALEAMSMGAEAPVRLEPWSPALEAKGTEAESLVR
jgi:hypothetical protein